MILNVLLEMILILGAIFKLVKKGCSKKKMKTTPEFKKPGLVGGFGVHDNKIRGSQIEEVGVSEENEEEKEEDDFFPEDFMRKRGKSKEEKKTKEKIDIRKKNRTKPLRFGNMGPRRIQGNWKKKNKLMGKNRLLQ